MKTSEGSDVQAAIQRVLQQLDQPLVDAWNRARPGYVMVIAERLGVVAAAARDPRPDYRKDLVEQLAELAANVVAMLTEEMLELRAEETESARRMP